MSIGQPDPEAQNIVVTDSAPLSMKKGLQTCLKCITTVGEINVRPRVACSSLRKLGCRGRTESCKLPDSLLENARSSNARGICRRKCSVSLGDPVWCKFFPAIVLSIVSQQNF
jgi:hypothetical protein